MAVVIEDGSVVAGANSFATVAEARTYAANRGTTLPASDTEVEQALVKAGDFLLSYEQKLKGYRVSAAQTMVFPRMSVLMFNEVLDYTTIPQQVKDAQILLASYVADGVDLRPIGDGRETRREKVGLIETEFFEGGRTSVDPVFTAINDILGPLMGSAGGNFFPVRRA